MPAQPLPPTASLRPAPSPAAARPLRPALAAVAAVALLAGCMGLPPGAADTGHAVTITYTAYDLADGRVLRENRTVTFTVGAGDSGLGGHVESAVRGHRENETFEVNVVDDPSLDYSEAVEVNRSLAPIPVQQDAPRADFARFVGEPTEGLTFAAYGIYTGQVTNVTNETVRFRILAEDGQEDAVPSVGATLVTTVTETELLRRLDPVEGATFTIAPPSPFQPTTPLGLQPGSYRVAGATEETLQYQRSASAQPDLVGRDLRVVITVVDVVPPEQAVPTGGNHAARGHSQVNGDPATVLGRDSDPVPTETVDGHDEDSHDDGH